MSKIKNEMENLDSIIFDVLANGNNSYYVGKDGNITEVSNILNGYANINAKVTLIKKNDNNNLVHIQLFDDDDYAYCSVMLEELPTYREWYSIIRGLHFHCDIHYNYPELERYIGGFQPLSANENLELTAYGMDTLKLIIRMATDAYTDSVKNRYNIF